MMNWLAVAAGGALGALARYSLGYWFYAGPDRLPYATLVANTLGCFLMGVLYVMIVERALLPPWWRQLAMVGFLGALTTFSSFAIEGLGLLKSGETGLAVVYCVLSFVLCLSACWLGYTLAEHSIAAS